MDVLLWTIIIIFLGLGAIAGFLALLMAMFSKSSEELRREKEKQNGGEGGRQR